MCEVEFDYHELRYEKAHKSCPNCGGEVFFDMDWEHLVCLDCGWGS